MDCMYYAVVYIQQGQNILHKLDAFIGEITLFKTTYSTYSWMYMGR